MSRNVSENNTDIINLFEIRHFRVALCHAKKMPCKKKKGLVQNANGHLHAMLHVANDCSNNHYTAKLRLKCNL